MWYKDAGAWLMFVVWAIVMGIIFLVFYINDKKHKKDKFFDTKNSRDYLYLREWLWDHSLTIKYSDDIYFGELYRPTTLTFKEEGDTLCLRRDGMIIDVWEYVSLSRTKGDGTYRYPIHYIKKDNNNVYNKKSLYIEITIISYEY